VTARIVPDGPTGRRVAIAALAAGGIVAIPTDTVYGIAVSASSPGGVERLFEAKRRPAERAIVLLLADAEQAGTLGVLTPAGEALANAFWPGGLTLVLSRRPAGGGDPGDRQSVDHDSRPAETVGVRVPNHGAPRALAHALGPLPTTSANRSGEPEARDAKEIEATLGEAVALILDGGPSPGGPPSTVVDVTGPAARILRVGAVPIGEIEAALRDARLPEPVGR
jgi:L-threonylcarbamoyladenylate synthase